MNFTNNNGNNGNNGFNNGYNNNGYNNGYNNGNTQFNQSMFNNQNMNNGYNNGYNQGGFGFNQQQYNNQYNNYNGQGVQQQNSSLFGSFANPRLKSLSKHAGEVSDEGACTFTGVAAKTIYFVMVFALGLVAFFILHSTFAKSSVTGDALMYPQEYPIYIGAIVLSLVAGIVTAFAPKTTAFFGTIYCVCMGYLVTFTSFAYAREYQGIVYEALGLTLLIIGVLTVLYSKGVIRVTSRFRKITYTTLIVSLLGGLIFAIMYMVAPNSSIVSSIIKINNGPIGILFAVIGVIIAAAVLTCDFDNAAQTVQMGLPKTYEWVASFGLITGVIYLYLKVLQLLARIQNNK